MKDAISLDELEEATGRGNWEELLHPIDTALLDLPAVVVDPLQQEAIGHGKSVPLQEHDLQKGDEVRVYNRERTLIALMSYDPVSGQLNPIRVLSGQ